jgi:phosphotransferase system enzyme I (PtsI)
VKPLTGIGASPGLVVGPAAVWRRSHLQVEWKRVADLDASAEIDRLEAALESARSELLGLQAQLQARLGRDHATILDAQLLILEDEEFLGAVHRSIRDDGLSAEIAFTRAMAEALIPLDLSGDVLFRERMVDFRDVEQRVLGALRGTNEAPPVLTDPCILVARELTPSQTASIDLNLVQGFVIEEGGHTGHTAIIARSLGVPAVVGLARASRSISTGDDLAVDGTRGRVYVDPDSDTRRRFEVRIHRRREAEQRLLTMREAPAETTDGHRIELSANVELPQEIPIALANGAQGIGLVRTEYFYFRTAHLPSEEEQLASYLDVLGAVGGGNVIFRVLDVGGDKLIAAMGGVREYNPFLGVRGARFLLRNPEILQTQLRALYRASASGSMKLMFPMVCDVEELRAFHSHCEQVRSDLRTEGHVFDEDLELGVMIETPSAIAMAPELARECDFFSLGTNDLTQYLLAVDRTNARVAHLSRPEHPAVLRAIRDAVSAGHDAGIWVGSCGEMGSNPLWAILLVGLGVDEISTNAAAVPMIKKVIRSVSYDQARTWSEEALAMSTASEVERLMRARSKRQLREFLGGSS